MSCSIEIHNLGVTYANGQEALSNINITLEPYAIHGIVGINGAGKSTLFKAIMGFVKPTIGSITIAKHSVKKALKSNIVSYVPQTEDVDWNFPVLVKDVVMMGRYTHMGFLRRASLEDEEAVKEALQRVNMLEFEKRQIGELSGGQKKRVFVARALAQNAKIILLDEPFTGVDIKTEDALIALFQELAKEGKLILVSTHNLGSVPSFCDNVILINKTILAHGPVETTFTHENLGNAFGGMLRHHQLVGNEIHDDDDDRSLSVITDDERPLVLYGKQGGQKISRHKKKTSNKND